MGRFFTTRQVGEMHQAPEWEVRRIVDQLEPPVDRFGLKRMIPDERVGEIAARLRHRQPGEAIEAVGHDRLPSDSPKTKERRRTTR
mgnify:CR=1 FL=1